MNGLVRKILNKISRVAIFAIIIALLVYLPEAGAAGSSFDVNDDGEMDARYDWVINVKVEDSKFLSYPGSKLTPLSKLKISYRLNPRFAYDIPTAGQYIDYEELWYHHTQVVGSRRLHDLNIPATYQGAIRLLATPSIFRNDDAAAGATIRLLPDLALQNCKLSLVFVPTEIFGQFISDLSRYRFYTNADQTMPSGICLPLSTSPLGITQSLYYSGNL